MPNPLVQWLQCMQPLWWGIVVGTKLQSLLSNTSAISRSTSANELRTMPYKLDARWLLQSYLFFHVHK